VPACSLLACLVMCPCSAWCLPATACTPATAPPPAWRSVPVTPPLARATTGQAGWLWLWPQGQDPLLHAQRAAGTFQVHLEIQMRVEEACWGQKIPNLGSSPAQSPRAVRTRALL
jgi:hypothetical protein